MVHLACSQCGSAPAPVCACGRLEAGWVLAEQAVAVWMPATAHVACSSSKPANAAQSAAFPMIPAGSKP